MNMTETLDNRVTSTTTAVNPNQHTLRECVQIAMKKYLSQLDGFPAANIYDMVFAEVEAPLLETILQYTKGNQSKAAIILGISRGTLRKKLKLYGLDE